MKFFYLILLSTIVFSKSYQAKLIPFKTYIISSEVNAKVLFVKDMEQYKNSNKIVIKLDDTLDISKSKNLNKKIVFFNDIIKIKTINLNRLLKIRGKSKIAKDNSKIDLLNLKIQLLDLKDNLQTIKKTIDNKNISAMGLYISEIYINENELVTVGRRLLKLEDRTKAKLVIYVNLEDITDIENKSILVDGKAENFKILKFSASNDSKFSSSYKVELVAENVDKRFGEILNIEIK